MQDLPDPWAEYAHLQARSSRNSKIDSYSWGVEEEMNLFLEHPYTCTDAEPGRSERVRATAARRERARACLRQLHETELAPNPASPAKQLEAREALRQIEAEVTPAQWALAVALAQGYSYADMSAKQAISAGAARAQIFRLRQQFMELRPAA